MYDNQNVFAKILRGEIEMDRAIFENEYALSFYDINPMFEKHALIIPKGEYQNMLDFLSNAPEKEQTGFWMVVAKTAEILDIKENYNIMANAGADAPFIKQTVFHFHLHLVSNARTESFSKALKSL